VQQDYPKVGVGAIVLNLKNEVLLQLRMNPPESGFWSLPGGRVEFGELVEQTIVREVKEEVGLVVSVERLVCVTDHIVPADTAHWVSPVYLVRIVSGVAENLEPRKTARIAWFSLSNLPTPLSMSARAALAEYSKAKLLPR
jgi:8-oxo-dGTP diphosphatase